MALANPILSRLQTHNLDSIGESSWRRLRDLIPPIQPGALLLLKVARAVRRGEQVVIGSAAQPYESLHDRRRLLELLPHDRSLVVRLRCCGRGILEDLPLLVELDRVHDLSVEWIIDQPRRLAWTHQQLAAAGRLAAEGIRTRLLWRADERWDSTELEAWLAEARRRQIWDVDCETSSQELRRHFQGSRLKHGFPVYSPGRG